MTNEQQVPRGIINLADRIGVSGDEMAAYMGPALTTTLRWLEGDSHDIQDLVDELGATPEAHDVADGFEMSAAECAAFIDEAIQAEQADPETRTWTAEYLRKMQEVSYHLHWHCANLDGS